MTVEQAETQLRVVVPFEEEEGEGGDDDDDFETAVAGFGTETFSISNITRSHRQRQCDMSGILCGEGGEV
jgi:hypothetical protein